MEMLDDYFCELCKGRVADQLYGDKVHPDAFRAVIIGAFSVFALGFLVGPYAFWRARHASHALARAPWLRGVWHVRAAYTLAGFGFVLGALWLVSRVLPGGA